MKSSRRAIVFCAVAAMIATASVGCSSGAASSGSSQSNCKRSTEKTIAMDYPYTNLPLFSVLKKYADKRAASRGYKLTWTADNLKLDAQVNSLQALVAQNVPAILTLPLEPSTIEPIAQQAMAKCIVVVTYAAQLKHEDSSLGLSNNQTGEDLAANAVAWADKQSFPIKALILNDNDSAAAKERIDGVLDGLKKARPGKIDIVANQKATSPQDAQNVAQQILQAHPEINMILGFDDDWALAGLQAIRNLGRSDTDPKLYVGGMDGAANALTELQKNNAFRATIGYDLTQVASLMVDIPADILQGKKVAPVVNAKLYTLTPGDPNVAKFLQSQS